MSNSSPDRAGEEENFINIYIQTVMDLFYDYYYYLFILLNEYLYSMTYQ